MSALSQQTALILSKFAETILQRDERPLTSLELLRLRVCFQQLEAFARYYRPLGGPTVTLIIDGSPPPVLVEPTEGGLG